MIPEVVGVVDGIGYDREQVAGRLATQSEFIEVFGQLVIGERLVDGSLLFDLRLCGNAKRQSEC